MVPLSAAVTSTITTPLEEDGPGICFLVNEDVNSMVLGAPGIRV